MIHWTPEMDTVIRARARSEGCVVLGSEFGCSRDAVGKRAKWLGVKLTTRGKLARVGFSHVGKMADPLPDRSK
jgi:hypothetical protein